jgi:hypothetical protein
MTTPGDLRVSIFGFPQHSDFWLLTPDFFNQEEGKWMALIGGPS